MKITKQKLKQIIKEEFAKLSEVLPPHLQSKVDAYEKKKQKFSITDVTPPGYGPEEPEEEEFTPGTDRWKRAVAAQKRVSDAFAAAGDEEEDTLEE
tara:strand:- start:4983 stop:5270 length:288 start_codon:yes stop_codon:yes gene_type:complete